MKLSLSVEIEGTGDLWWSLLYNHLCRIAIKIYRVREDDASVTQRKLFVNKIQDFLGEKKKSFKDTGTGPTSVLFV